MKRSYAVAFFLLSLTLVIIFVICMIVTSFPPTEKAVLPPKRKLLWQEEFDTFNKTTWKHLITAWRGGNAEFQYYTNRSENSFVRNGTLYIKPTLTSTDRRFNESFLYNGTLDLRSEGCNIDYDGGCFVKANEHDIINPIQSARIVTENSFSFTYGIIEVRAQMPKGDWLWPAIWMLPTNNSYGDWPRSGEIDIVEVKGNSNYSCNGLLNGRQQAGSTLHWGPETNLNKYHLTHWQKVSLSPDFSSEFHVYRVDWLPTNITFYVDGVMIGSVTPPDGGFWELGKFNRGPNIWRSGTRIAPFDKNFHFVINLAVGGNFFSDSCDNFPYPKPWSKTDRSQMKNFWEKRGSWLPSWIKTEDDDALKVDYIRVYSIG